MAEFTSLNGYQVKDTVARSIAKGRNQAVAFVDYATMIETLNGLEKDEYRSGQNIYIGVVGVPDLWVYGIEDIVHNFEYVSDEGVVEMLTNNTTIQVGYYKLAMLEGQKVDLTTYDQHLLKHDDDISGLNNDISGLNNDIAGLNEGLGNISNIGNEIYNSFEKLLKYYIDNGYLPSVNEPNIKLTLYELTLDSYLYVTLNNDGTATLYGVIQSSAVLTNSPIISILPNNCRPKSDVSFTVDQGGTARTIKIKNDGILTVSALHNARPISINYTYSLE